MHSYKKTVILSPTCHSLPHQKGAPLAAVHPEGQETADGFPQQLGLHPSGGVVRRGNALLQFLGELHHKGASLDSPALAAGIQREIAGDPREKGKEILRRAAGRYGVPSPKIGVVLALLRGGTVLCDAKGETPQAAAVLFTGGCNGGFIP